MKKLFILLLFFVSPFVLLSVFYVFSDPFKVIYHYDSYYIDNEVNPVYLNKDHVGTQNLLNRKQERNYNSFILGNSRSMFYEVKTWASFLDSGSNCYHLDASAESLYGLHNKITFLDEQQFNLKNIMIVMDENSLAKLNPGSRQLDINSPLNSKEVSAFYFQYVFFKTFFNIKFLIPYIHYKLNGNKVKDYMYNLRLLDNKYIGYNATTNEYQLTQVNNEISEGKYYTPAKIAEFTIRYPNEYAAPCLTEAHIQLLKNMANIFSKHNTKLKFVISPAYQQVRIDTTDLAALKTIFGKEAVYDFSGKNDLTESYLNFYEKIHYRPFVADSVMRYIYTH